MSRRIRNKANGPLSLIAPVLFLMLFILIGLGFFVGFYAVPKWKAYKSMGWPTTKATIEFSDIQKHGDDSVSYSPKVSYRYSINGEQYTSDRFWFRMSNVNSRAYMEEIMKPFAAGAQVEAYYDPETPTTSVLVRSSEVGWIAFILPLVFVFIPSVILFGILSGNNNSAAKPRTTQTTSSRTTLTNSDNSIPTGIMSTSGNSESNKMAFESSYCRTETDDTHQDQPHVMKSSGTPMGGFLGALFATLIWNGLTYGILWAILHEEGFMWIPVLIATPFALIGLLLVYATCYSFLKLFNPRPTVVCSNSLLYPGGEYELSWTFSGRSSSLQSLKVVLIGIETVSYRQGTSTRTDTNDFCRKEVFQTSDAAQIAEGFTLMQIPEDMMYTFVANHNSVKWYIELSAAIKFWPDVSEKFEIDIYPPKLSA